VSIRDFFRAHLKVFAGLALAALVGLLAVGAVHLYRYRTGADSAFQALRAALQTGDKAGLAVMVDFRALSEDIVQAVIAVYPQAATNETQQAELRDEAQRLALHALGSKKSTKPESAASRKPFAPVAVVPEDVIAQIAAGLKLETGADGMQIRSQFTHGGLQADFPLRLRMERRQGGWLVTRLLNAQEVISVYKGAVDALRAGDEAAWTAENEKILARMRAHFHAPQCLAAVNLLGNKREAILVVKVTADNTDTTTLHHVNLLCDIRAGNGTRVYSRHLNVVQRVYGGGSFANTWTVVLDAAGEDAVRLLRAGPLSCTVEPRVLSIGVGEVLYPRKND
jgi:hypothetical protein